MSKQGNMGFFGKLPTAGDFVQRRLPAAFVDAWDTHFQQAVSVLRQRLGTAWPGAYAGSPAWRFVLAPGVAGEHAWAGLMGPSTDRVGRLFPIVLAHRLTPGPGMAVRLLDAGHAWFDTVQTLYVAGQERRMDVDAFDRALAEVDDPATIAVPDMVGALRATDWTCAPRWRVSFPEVSASGAWLAELWARLIATSGPWCLWWTQTGAGGQVQALATRGLPDGESLMMFVGAAESAATTSAWAVPAGLGTEVDVQRPASVQRDWQAPVAAATVSDEDVTVPVVTLGAGAAAPAMSGQACDATVPTAQARRVDVADPPPVTARALRVEALGGRIQALVVDDGGRDPRRQAASRAVDVVRRWALDADPEPMQALGEQLLHVHRQLRVEQASQGVVEDGVVVALRTDGAHLELMRVGSAGAWLWRDGTLRSLFDSAETALGGGGELDDLLNGTPSPIAPGLGAGALPECHYREASLLPGDRVLILATRALVELGEDVIVGAMTLASSEQTAKSIARHGRLQDNPKHWPIAVIEVAS